MFRFKNEKGLTLIELLITISVLAIVSAIALPVINNVVTSSNSNALTQTIKDADAFIQKYSKSGVVAYDGLTRTFSGYIDSDGDNVIDPNEKIDNLTLDEKYSISVDGSAQVSGQYSNGGVTGVTITVGGEGTAPAGNAALSNLGTYSGNGLFGMYSGGAPASETWSAETPIYLDLSAWDGSPKGSKYVFTNYNAYTNMVWEGSTVTQETDGSTKTVLSNGRTSYWTKYTSNPTAAGWTIATSLN